MGGLIFKPVELACTVAYPAWQTYKSLEHADKHGGEVVIRQQLMYWLIFAMIHIVDSLFGFILQWVPLYSVIKFLVLCVACYLKGATIIYNTYIKEVLRNHEEQIDASLDVGVGYVKKKTGGTWERAQRAGMNYLHENPDVAKHAMGSMGDAMSNMDDDNMPKV
mmetsp:Transcript_41500/g.110690  ORF Transcript_41500/g.110690 Transcript_41500/m.110690 type:complete len:164 (-) Transcript_41500:80-571(-)|eukprot:CAMPEP_0119541800 /NCGR_PEP_ID=MMETSP1344-20130328/53186_1 /TAXON_ID=236787 /ORGANISM="Florenciella parvula, Strain CCMP2471" /LENGTH=163 /DNA_ID=CAMNT_0007585869 /DNA_START=69 /DNA_END=560 /DNA_ORIENTATION=-